MFHGYLYWIGYSGGTIWIALVNIDFMFTFSNLIVPGASRPQGMQMDCVQEIRVQGMVCSFPLWICFKGTWHLRPWGEFLPGCSLVNLLWLFLVQAGLWENRQGLEQKDRVQCRSQGSFNNIRTDI